MTRISKQIAYCQVHNKYRTQNGRWLDAGFNKEELHQHEEFLLKEHGAVITVSDICDECNDTSQTKLDLPDFNW